VSSVHRDAAVGFDRGAADYERGRPGYPDAAITLVARELRIKPGDVARLVDERGITEPDGSFQTPYRTHALWCRRG
jgi:hypothetical protein